MTEKYWKKRSAKRMFSYIDKADKVADVVGKAYLNAVKYLQIEAEKVFEAYRRNTGLSEHEAKQLLSKVGNKLDYESFKRVYNKVKDPEIRKTLLAQLDAPAYRARLQRLEGLRKKVFEQCNEIYGVELKEANKHLFELANDAYNLSMYDIQKGIGYGFEFAQLSKEGIEEILKNEWSGEHYSKRIWDNTKTVAELVKNEIFLGEMVGKSAHDMSAAIMDKMGVGAMQARRLIRTESCFVANQAEMESYKECDLERYRFVATLDLVTSAVCAALNGKTFPIDQQQPGVNCPPMHPNCRSTTIACIDDDDLEGLKRRARDPVTGENVTLPADITYDEWMDLQQEKYGVGEIALRTKMAYNRNDDRKQYEKYAKRLGTDMPKSFSDFQKLKYANSSEYKELGEYYKYKGKVPEATAEDYRVYKAIKSIGILGVVRVPPQSIDTSILVFNDSHAENHGCSLADAIGYIEKAKCSISRKRWDGVHTNYYSFDGAAYVSDDTKKIKTAFSSDDFDSRTKELMEVFE